MVMTHLRAENLSQRRPKSYSKVKTNGRTDTTEFIPFLANAANVVLSLQKPPARVPPCQCRYSRTTDYHADDACVNKERKMDFYLFLFIITDKGPEGH